MNIYSNVDKENNSKRIMLAIVSLLLVVAAIAVYQANRTAAVIQSTDSGVRMTEIDRIKQKIREKVFDKDQATAAGAEAAQAGNFDKAKAMADQAEKLTREIERLYNDLHEANLREGENGENKKTQ